MSNEDRLFQTVQRLYEEAEERKKHHEDIVISDQEIRIGSIRHYYSKTIFKNCDFILDPYDPMFVLSKDREPPCELARSAVMFWPLFLIEKDASVLFENCRFRSRLSIPYGGEHPPFISAAENSTLTFINCSFKNVSSFIRSDGAVKLRGCEIVYMDSYIYRRDSDVKDQTDAYPFFFIRANGEDVELTDCSFDCAKSYRFSVKLALAHGKLIDCKLKNVQKVDPSEIEEA